MSLFKSSLNIETKIDGFFDTVAEGGLVYRAGVRAYMAGNTADFENAIVSIDKLEAQADKLSKEVEAHLYSHSLIPEHRGDVLGLLENSDDIIDTAKTCLNQFSIEQPLVPEEFHDGFCKLSDAGCAAVEAVIFSARAFFKDVNSVKDNLYKVHHFEKEADGIGDRLKRSVFASDLDLAHKVHLRYFALNVEKVSDMAEDVADRLAIYAIKRTI
jgi:predicted phosphate transport protein (TIGR00153 family)